jgi:hypothetical protein
MREIKFRAWNGERYVFGPRKGEINPSWVLAMCSANDMEPEQFTGLYDKHGTEIYEGDILSVPGWPDFQPVVFEDGCYYAKFGGNRYRVGGWKAGTVKVVGNIHETPELLQS